ncbi:hypothetical protein [Amycolatopsis cihanbeyliensis]|uniref:Small secreted protein n=1 Tax=Amycolatopsis cihanbeyliensis TaxID=1128664 RepID=A0A542DR23_AMYCI|nr:hypothetical protein [Amycolatopsis cihanbeyliensis]TQJ05540.1 hypothetical protein FB471_5377 [Amycolatopsis cihanbeyliensis]
MLGRIGLALTCATVGGLALSGCDSGSSDPIRDPATDWAGQVCTVAADHMDTLTGGPSVDAQDLAKSKQLMVTHLGELAEAVGAVANGITEAGPPPAEDAAPVIERTVGKLRQAKQSVNTAREKLAAAAPENDEAFRDTMGSVGADLTALGRLDDPLRDLRLSQELSKAFGQAPACGQAKPGGIAPTD